MEKQNPYMSALWVVAVLGLIFGMIAVVIPGMEPIGLALVIVGATSLAGGLTASATVWARRHD